VADANDDRDLDDIIDLDSVYKVSPEAGLFAPRHVGEMTKSARSYPVIFVERPRGIHPLLCKVGLHAWGRQVQGIPALLRNAPQRCAVCGVLRG